MNSGKEMDMDLGSGGQGEAAFFEELGFGGDLMFHTSEFNITGEDLMLSSALTITDLQPVEMEDVKFTVPSETPVTSTTNDTEFTYPTEVPGTSSIEDVEFTDPNEAPGSVKMEDEDFTVTSLSAEVGVGVKTRCRRRVSMAKDESGVKGHGPGTKNEGGINKGRRRRQWSEAKDESGVKGRGRRGSKAADENRVKSRTYHRAQPKDEMAKVLHLRPPRKLKHRVSQAVPEEEKTEEYYEHRRKNTEAARKCREKKRGLDEKRVELIKWQDARIKELEARVASLEHDNKLYQGVIAQLGQKQQVTQGQAPHLSLGHRRFPKKKKSHRRDHE